MFREVRLTRFEQQIWASKVAVSLYLESLKAGHKDRHGFAGDRLTAHFWGACGEIAYGKATGQYVADNVNTFKAPDVGSAQVRTTRIHHGDLIIRPGDKDDDWFVLVTVDPNTSPDVFHVHGGILGKDAKRDEWWTAPNNDREKAWFVPQSALTAWLAKEAG